MTVPLNGASNTFGLYRATANITLGAVMNGLEIIFKNALISAECGLLLTSYSVEFNYTDIESPVENCEEKIDGACVYPSHDEGIIFSITEYTNTDFDVEVTDETRAKLAGEKMKWEKGISKGYCQMSEKGDDEGTNTFLELSVHY